MEHMFKPGKLTILLDGGAGSSGKGKIGSYITQNTDNWQFCCNSFSAQAGHWVKLDDGRKYFYQSLNSCAYQDKYEKMYIGPGSHIELPALLREIEENNVKEYKLGIHPLAVIIEDRDAQYERGEITFEGEKTNHDGTSKFGSTCHGIGSSKARRILRKPDLKCAKDIPELKKYICDVEYEIMSRLDKGQSGFLEIAQGFQLSLMHKKFYPYVTSRNVTTSAALSDMFLPPKYAGPIIINFRTYPIRINSNKYIDKQTGKHLTWDEVEKQGIENVTIYKGNSGPGYSDQEELTWENITKNSGSKEKIQEITSVTKLPRRVFTFSKQNLLESIQLNDTGHEIYISINFADYVDSEIYGIRDKSESSIYNIHKRSPKLYDWIISNILEPLKQTNNKAKLKFIGTGPKTEDTILIKE